MSKITKQFVPYKQAKELQELGFDEPCFGFYYNDKSLDVGLDKREMQRFTNKRASETETYECIAPLYQQAFEWFREKYDLNPWIDCNSDKKWIWTINFIEVGDYIQSDDWLEELENLPDSYETFQEAQLACLDKLIELVKEKK